MSGLVVSRRDWGAAEPRVAYEPVGPLWALVLHHTGGLSDHLHNADLVGEAAYVRLVQQRHFAREFSDIGYHFLIMPSGRIFLGRPPRALGAHVKGWNRGTLSICLAGDFDRQRPTAAALDSIDRVRSQLAGVAPLPLIGHSDLAPKRCPGRLLSPYVDPGAPPVEQAASPEHGEQRDVVLIDE